MKSILKLNADVGEGMTNDPIIMPYLTYANIACGGHYGNSDSMTQTVRLAKQHKVLVGAHPSYPDIENFGRKTMSIATVELYEEIHRQIQNFYKICKQEGVKMHHIKLHGALYNDIFSTADSTQFFINWVKRNYPLLNIFVPLSAEKFLLSEQKNSVLIEVFADRSYNEDASLVSRQQVGAVLGTVDKVKKQLAEIQNGQITTLRGKKIPIIADTVCLHGDHPKIEAIVKLLSSEL